MYVVQFYYWSPVSSGCVCVCVLFLGEESSWLEDKGALRLMSHCVAAATLFALQSHPYRKRTSQ